MAKVDQQRGGRNVVRRRGAPMMLRMLFAAVLAAALAVGASYGLRTLNL